MFESTFCLPSAVILDYTFSYIFVFLSFSFFFLSYTTILLITAKCKEQNWVLKQLNHKPPYSDVTTVFYPVCLFIFSLAGILIFSTRHIGTIIFTLFYAPCCVCLQAHSKRLLPQQLIIFQALWDLFTSLCQRGTMFFAWL